MFPKTIVSHPLTQTLPTALRWQARNGTPTRGDTRWMKMRTSRTFHGKIRGNRVNEAGSFLLSFFHPSFMFRFPFVSRRRFNLIRRESAIYFPGPGSWWLPLVEPRLISLALSIRPCRNRKRPWFHEYRYGYERLVMTTFDGRESDSRRWEK